MAMRYFFLGNILIHPQLPQCKLQYRRDFLQLEVFVLKMGNPCTNTTQNTKVVPIVFKVGSVNHVFDGHAKL